MSERDIPLIERKRCSATTCIDREGMGDLECQEEPGHLGFHRYQDKNMVVLWDYTSTGHLAAQSSYRLNRLLNEQRKGMK